MKINMISVKLKSALTKIATLESGSTPRDLPNTGHGEKLLSLRTSISSSMKLPCALSDSAVKGMARLSNSHWPHLKH